MTRIASIAIITAIVVLGFLGIMFLKDSYMLLPIKSTPIDTSPFANWRDYQAPGGKFRVMLPTTPQRAEQTTRDPRTKELRHYDMYVAQENDGSTYMISIIKFPENKQSPEEIQKTIVNDLMAANPANQLKNMKVGQFKQFKTLDFEISNPDTTINGMTFMEGNTLYLLGTIARNSALNPAEYQYFIKSFDLSGKQEGK